MKDNSITVASTIFANDEGDGFQSGSIFYRETLEIDSFFRILIEPLSSSCGTVEYELKEAIISVKVME